MPETPETPEKPAEATDRAVVDAAFAGHKFKEGDTVRHKGSRTLEYASVVVGRLLSAAGERLYHLRSFQRDEDCLAFEATVWLATECELAKVPDASGPMFTLHEARLMARDLAWQAHRNPGKAAHAPEPFGEM